MNTPIRGDAGRHGGLVLLRLGLVLGFVAVGKGAPPIDPLPAPEYSFDLESQGGQYGIVEPGDILTISMDQPSALVPRVLLSLDSPEDDLDALSASNHNVAANETFLLLFSVGRGTTGGLPPDPLLIEMGLPYNVWDQALRAQAPGDQFLSTSLFDRNGWVAGSQTPEANNALDRNNYNEGGTSFGAYPPTAAHQQAGFEPLDCVDATARLPLGGQGDGVERVYFSLSADSPSLNELPGSDQPSGAHIFYNLLPGATATTMFAPFGALGLVQADDIDALLVLDMNDDGVFTTGDAVIFSLAPGSPSLTTLPEASPQGAGADLFKVAFGFVPELYAAAVDVGLGAPGDDLDALDYAFCSAPLLCAVNYCIRALAGDLNCDYTVDFFDIEPFVLAITDPDEYCQTHPACDITLGDCNHDGDVDFFDIDPFVLLITGG